MRHLRLNQVHVPALHRAVPEDAAVAVIPGDPSDRVVVPCGADWVLALQWVRGFSDFQCREVPVCHQLLDGRVVAEEIARPRQIVQRRVRKASAVAFLALRTGVVEAITLWNALRPPACTEIIRSVCHGCPLFEKPSLVPSTAVCVPDL